MEAVKIEISEYEQQGIDFLEKHNITFEAIFLKYDFHFNEDKEKRDIYCCVFERNKRKLEIIFGQSVKCSQKLMDVPRDNKDYYPSFRGKMKNKNYRTPTAYDVLACLTKYNPSTFEDFCSDYGYSTDSRSAEKTYKAVVGEWLKVSNFFTTQEIEEMQEIN